MNRSEIFLSDPRSSAQIRGCFCSSLRPVVSYAAFNPASFVAFIGEEEFRDSMATPNGNLSADGHHVGKVVQIIGPVLDVEFETGYLPPIYHALRVVSEGVDVPTPIDVIAQVQRHLG